ncbi:MAG TPA: aldo/keto reductase [Candidatus Acidoferrales bacterium]
MKMRKLGRSGIETSPLILGGNVFGWTVDEGRGFRILDAFVAAGFNCIDTADIYSQWVPGHVGGESEALIGRWLKLRGNRSKVSIFTKVGMAVQGKKGLSRARILEAVEGSLSRLETDYIDLYQSHEDDPNTPQEETLGAYANLIKQGKVRAIGASNFKVDRLAATLEISKKSGLPRYESLQPDYSLMEREGYEGALQSLCVKEDIGVINYWPLASGFLTGKYRSEVDLKKSPRGQGVKKYLDDQGLKTLAALDQVAKSKGATPAQVALAWCMARPGITAPIASATNLDQLDELLQSVNVQLDRASIDLLDQASGSQSAASA